MKAHEISAYSLSKANSIHPPDEELAVKSPFQPNGNGLMP